MLLLPKLGGISRLLRLGAFTLVWLRGDQVGSFANLH